MEVMIVEVYMCSEYSVVMFDMIVVFFKQKTAYEMRISDWSSDVCSSDLEIHHPGREIGAAQARHVGIDGEPGQHRRSVEAGAQQIGRASCRERVCQYV